MTELASAGRGDVAARASVPARGLRVVMLTSDQWIDRRIVLEAQSLIDHGFDVYVLAAPANDRPSFDHDGRVPIERIDVDRYGPSVEHLLLRALRKDTWRSFARVALRGYRFWRAGVRQVLGHVEVLLDFLRIRQAGVLVPPLQLSSYEYVFFRRARFYRPDFVHVHDLPLLRVATAISAATGARLVYDMHEFYPEQIALRGRPAERARRMERRHIRLTDARFTVNHFLARLIAEAYGVEVGVVQNATLLPEGLHDRRHDRFREDLGIGSDQRVLLIQGWLAPNRNLEKVVTGMAFVSAPAVLVLMGYGDYRADLETAARRAGVEDRVFFLGAKGQDELLTYTASADVGLIPYPRGVDANTTYVSPNKLYEFIAARTPILGNDIPFVREVVEGNGFGVVADLETPEAVGSAIDAFPYDRLAEFRERLAERGAEWTWQREQMRLLEIYDTMLERTPATEARGRSPARSRPA